MIPLSVPNLSGRELQYVKKCIDTNWVSSAGSFVRKFEEALCHYVKSPYAVACVSGTAGLQVALRLCGVKTNDEVIVGTLTFIAPVNAVKYLGAEPVFMDCDDYMNIDPVKLEEFCVKECKVTKEGLRNKSTGRIIRALVPVHIFGNPCDMKEIMRIAKAYRLKVIEDATESLGAYYTSGSYKNKFTGTIGDIGVFSFNGNKIITTGGGGMIVTGDKAMAQKAGYLVDQAKDDPVNYIHHEIGYNFRMNNVQAAMGLAQLEQLKKFIRIKKSNYELYGKLLRPIKGVRLLGIPPGTSPNYWFYSLLVDRKEYGIDRNKLMDHLSKQSIQSRPVWYLNHLQLPYGRNQAYKIENAVKFRECVLNLPCSTTLKENEIEEIVIAVRIFGRSQGEY
ncbi:MAG: LegC family aminotransferase [Candidatus Omnitrophica bacterium]|nr:LegC family aminotransferase [Candidatus Omnitrophota bacterium]